MTKVKLLMVGVVLIACSTKSASEFPTSNMRADMTATATGNGGTSVSATLRDPSEMLTFLQLTADDEFTATEGSNTQPMKESSLLGMVAYTANFNKDAADTEFRVKLTRSLDSGAPNSSARLPKPFTLGTLPKNDFSRTEPILLSWTSEASTDEMTIEIAGDCIELVKANLGATVSSYTVEAGAIKKRTPSSSDDKVADECDATVSVRRQRTGSVDKAFKSGSFVASQVRALTFRSKP